MPLWRNIFAVSCEVKHTYDAAIPLYFTYEKKNKRPHRGLYLNLHRGFIHNSPKLEIIAEWIYKLSCIHIMELFSNINQ